MRKYKQLFQIGEVSELYRVSRKMLLNYEKKGLIKPSLIDSNTKYRYYDINDIARIGLILDLRKQKYP